MKSTSRRKRASEENFNDIGMTLLCDITNRVILESLTGTLAHDVTFITREIDCIKIPLQISTMT